MTLTHNALIPRFLIVACVATFILIFNSPATFYAVVILGQAHFLLAYLYQYKAGKINARYIIKYAIVFILLFGSYYLYGWSALLSTSAGFYFVIHFLYDERHLMSEPTSFEGWLRLCPLIVICTPHLFLLYGLNFFEPAKSISLLLAGLYITSRITSKKAITVQDIYFLIIFITCYFMVFSLKDPSQTQVLNFIILVHYGNWYLNYLVKFRSKPVAFKTLSYEMAICNALMLFLFYYYSIQPTPILSGFKYFFHGDYFSLWTLMHYLVTFRSSDLRNWLPDTFKTERLGETV